LKFSGVPSQQLPLRFPLQQKATFDAFVVGRNAELIHRLERLPEENDFALLWLWGAAGVGRSHLLQAVCHSAGAILPRVAYLPAREFNGSTESLAEFGNFQLVCIDDLQVWLESEAHQLSLMALYQELYRKRSKLVVTADRVPSRYAYCFADLASRFQAASTYEVSGLDDAAKYEYLKRQALKRGLILEDGVLNYLFNRVARDLPALLDLLDRLDISAMSRQRRLTIPFVREELGL